MVGLHVYCLVFAGGVVSGLMEGFWKGDSDLTGIRQKSAVQWAGVGMEEMSEEAIGSVVLLGGLFGWVLWV